MAAKLENWRLLSQELGSSVLPREKDFGASNHSLRRHSGSPRPPPATREKEKTERYTVPKARNFKKRKRDLARIANATQPPSSTCRTRSRQRTGPAVIPETGRQLPRPRAASAAPGAPGRGARQCGARSPELRPATLLLPLLGAELRPRLRLALPGRLRSHPCRRGRAGGPALPRL